MRVVFALACLLAVAAAAANIGADGAISKINGVASATDNSAAGRMGTGTVALIETSVAYVAKTANDVMWIRNTAATSGCASPTADELAQQVGWVGATTATTGNINIYLDISKVVVGNFHVCVGTQKDTYAPAKEGTPADIAMSLTAQTGSPALTMDLVAVDPATVVYYGQTVSLVGKGTPAAFAIGDMLGMGDTAAVAATNMLTVVSATTSPLDIVVKGTKTATADYKIWGIAPNKYTATENILAAQQISNNDITFKYMHATTNNTLTSAKVNGGSAETKAAANYTQGANFSFLLTNTIQGNDYYVVAVPTDAAAQKSCQDLINAGMYVNATQGTESPTWMAKNVGVYEIYVKSKAAAYSLDCTKQMFGTVNVVAPPPPPPTPAPTPAPTPVAPAPAPAASTTGTSSASAVRGGLLAAFACVLAGLGVSAAF